MTPATREAIAFFYKHAGWSWGPQTETEDEGRKRCARQLAEAEAEGRARGWHVAWEQDDVGEYCYETCDRKGEPHEHEILFADLRDAEDRRLGQSLGGIFDADRHYARVVAAELIDEALHEEASARAAFVAKTSAPAWFEAMP